MQKGKNERKKTDARRRNVKFLIDVWDVFFDALRTKEKRISRKFSSFKSTQKRAAFFGDSYSFFIVTVIAYLLFFLYVIFSSRFISLLFFYVFIYF